MNTIHTIPSRVKLSTAPEITAEITMDVFYNAILQEIWIMEIYSIKPFHIDSAAFDFFFCNLVCFVVFLPSSAILATNSLRIAATASETSTAFLKNLSSHHFLKVGLQHCFLRAHAPTIQTYARQFPLQQNSQLTSPPFCFPRSLWKTKMLFLYYPQK